MIKYLLKYVVISLVGVSIITVPQVNNEVINSDVQEVINEPTKVEVPVLSNSCDKTYMDYRSITDTNSTQYQYIANNMIHYNDTTLRTNDGYIGVALGSYFGPIGTKYEFHLSTGIILKVVKVEGKADCDTDSNNYCHPDGHVIEFVINSDYSSGLVGANGLIHNGNYNNCSDYNGYIVRIFRIEE